HTQDQAASGRSPGLPAGSSNTCGRRGFSPHRRGRTDGAFVFAARIRPSNGPPPVWASTQEFIVMDLRKLKTLIDLVADSGIAELEITEGEGKVRIVKFAQPAAGAPVRAEPAPPAGAVMTLDQPTLDFGTIEAGKKTTVEFTFKNTGTKPLKLEKKKLKSSCKCLVAILPRAPIAPGGQGVVKATFTAPRTAGEASHNLLIKYVVDPAAKAEASAVLALTGTVEPKKPRPRQPKEPRFEGRGFVLS
ncbi:MAG: DUF1573 domain-containing protein, partial [Deltaproteobacteria bacterium]|nr:DUF1573 domain-containing protein [Kofleriaceae bacterium]